jgi:Common central domain of tyrosinase
MALGDGIRRNIASVDPSERAMLRDAFIALNTDPHFRFPGSRNDSPAPGGVTWWFKQDEIHQATHVHRGPEFLPWHREIVNRLEEMLRQVNPQLSLHYWDWTQDPRHIPNANLGGGRTGTLNLFTSDGSEKFGNGEIFMGYGGSTLAAIAEPWLSAGYYDPNAQREGRPFRHELEHPSDNPADPPGVVRRCIACSKRFDSPASPDRDVEILNAEDYAEMREVLEDVHDDMHSFVAMGGTHISFRDPFVFLLHSNVDRLFTRWQTDPAHPDRLKPDKIYGSERGDPRLNRNVEPWSTGRSRTLSGRVIFTRPWCAPENEGIPHDYKDQSIVTPPLYDTNHFTLNDILRMRNISRPVSLRSLATAVGLTKPPISVLQLVRTLISS